MKKFIVVALFFCFRTMLCAQQIEITGMTKDFQTFQSAHLQEKIYVQTDKTVYLAGETIWFKIYTLLEQAQQLSPVSRVAYVEFGSPNVKTPVQEKINLDTGMGSGSLRVPANWPSGRYTLRVYTSWMKNFSEAFFYTQTLPVISPLYGASAKSPGSSPTTETDPKTTTIALQPVQGATLQFFPEGGNLLYGVDTKIAFRSLDREGHERPCDGFIVNHKNDTLLRFQSKPGSLHPGMGNFNITVHPGDSLFAYDYTAGKTARVPFPAVETSGYALHLAKVDASSLTFSVRAAQTGNNKTVYLLAHTHQVLKSIQSAPVLDGAATFTVDRSLLGEGISVFTLFNPDHQPVCERLFFTAPARTILHLSVSQPRYETRSPVSVLLAATDSTGGEKSGNLSLTVFRMDSLEEMNGKSMFSWYYLSSELKGNIEKPDSYFGTGPDTLEAVDDLMLTQGWRRFSWEKVFRTKTPGFTFLPEEEGPVLSAHAESRVTNQPAAGITFLLSFPGKEFQFSTASSDQNGHLLFTAPPFSGTTLGVIVPANSKDSDYRVDADPAYSEFPFPAALGMPALPRFLASTITARALSLQIENAYRMNEKKKWLPGAAIDSIHFYGMPDRSYQLAKYIRYPTMEEVMREFVEDVRVRREGKSFRFRVMNLLFKTFLDEDPLILLDGVPVSDPGKIMQLDPMKINDIDVVSHRFFKGTASFSGLISFRSESGDLGQTMLDPGAVVIDFEGLQKEREFYSPVYGDSVMRNRPVPDYRNTLAWIPRLRISPDGKKEIGFYTSDLDGHFAIIAEGISSDGKPLSGMTFFDVGIRSSGL